MWIASPGRPVVRNDVALASNEPFMQSLVYATADKFELKPGRSAYARSSPSLCAF
jgi:hypothetical protein